MENSVANVTMLDDEDADELLAKLEDLVDEREELDRQISRLKHSLESANCTRRAVALTIGSMRRIFGPQLEEASERREKRCELYLLATERLESP